jgi:hypothetical protein
MNYHTSGSQTKLDKTMTTEQFNQVVEAITAGKYSWACVLILRFAGYYPLHYIPYRTYHRLIKENARASTTNRPKADSLQVSAPSKNLEQLQDLNHLEILNKQQMKQRGGSLQHWLDTKVREYCRLKIELL